MTDVPKALAREELRRERQLGGLFAANPMSGVLDEPNGQSLYLHKTDMRLTTRRTLALRALSIAVETSKQRFGDRLETLPPGVPDHFARFPGTTMMRTLNGPRRISHYT